MTFDWPTLMRAGMRGLGLPPAVFWDLTPTELAVLLGACGAGQPMGRARLAELMSAFPDAAVPSAPGDLGEDETRSGR
ncbi:rcc01693 family protein [Roseivivax isoporae]|uniref:Phage tail assembly chaperone n=1 Tax=Roseivivax isoporae LMG 25204 TaxID=1449351 RepID=X7F669_9RHOB|nr:rcc01693 family protein [Roseivivax isoporae]ETX28248.1 hypothetical protein RISW2_09045 [Roseivivax isoporae LMG 25204]